MRRGGGGEGLQCGVLNLLGVEEGSQLWHCLKYIDAVARVNFVSCAPTLPSFLTPSTLFCRLLNDLPATRVTATSVDAFLQVGGYKLYALYGRQFVKMLHYIDQDFLADLKKVG